MHARSRQLCPTLCNPPDYNSPGSSVHRILQTRIPEWVAMPSSRGRDSTHVSYIVWVIWAGSLPLAPSRKPLYGAMKWSEVKSLSCVWLFATPWTVAYQAPPSMGFLRQEYWSGFAISFSRDMVPYKDINIIYLQVSVIFIKDYIEAKE